MAGSRRRLVDLTQYSTQSISRYLAVDNRHFRGCGQARNNAACEYLCRPRGKRAVRSRLERHDFLPGLSSDCIGGGRSLLLEVTAAC